MMNDQNDSDRELHRIAKHESGHVVANWHFCSEIIGVTLCDSDLGGSVWARGINQCSVIGSRSQAVITAAGCAAEGLLETTGDDRQRLMNIAQRLHGITATGAAIDEEIKNVEVAAIALTRQYALEIEVVAKHLLSFHLMMAAFEREPFDFTSGDSTAQQSH
jgi:hypothetical protein